MPRPSFRDYCHSIFSPFTQLAELPEKLDQLKTAALPGEALEFQIPILNSLQSKGKPTLLGGGGFILNAVSDREAYFFVYTEELSVDESDLLHDFMGELQVEIVEPMECYFLFVAHCMAGTLRIRKEYRRRDFAISLIGISDRADYIGHDTNYISNLFEAYTIYKTSIDNYVLIDNEWYLPTYISLRNARFRSEIASDSICVELEIFAEFVLNDLENVYNSLTSTHFSQMYLEIYRYIENVFSLPWGVKLKENLGLSGPAVAVAIECRKSLLWRAREDDSIRGIFSLIGYQELKSMGADKIDYFADVINSGEGDDEKAKMIGRRLYKIRNVLVHKEDYEDRTAINAKEILNEQFICFLIRACTYIYKKYSFEIEHLKVA